MSKEKVYTFIENLNSIICSQEMFNDIKLGRFIVDGSDRASQVQVSLGYQEKGKFHLIFNKTLSLVDFEGDQTSIVNSFYQQCYLELLRMSILLEDSVGNFKDMVTGIPIDVLSFKTLITEGLNKLNKTA